MTETQIVSAGLWLLSLLIGFSAYAGVAGHGGATGGMRMGGGRAPGSIGAGAPTLALFAGNLDGPGNVDGTEIVVRFNGLSSVATDSDGNVYLVDKENHTIRKITPAGVVSTFAGTAGASGSANGLGTAARFNKPYSTATDSVGNVYIADHDNHTIRKITPAGVVSTLAGAAGMKGNKDGAGAAARFISPLAVTVDGTGNVYVVDGNNIIRKITPAGVVTTLAGKAYADGSNDGIGADARFDCPRGIAADRAGNLYVADSCNRTIRKISPNGAVSTLAGKPGTKGSTDGIGAQARFLGPTAIAVDPSGNLYVADDGYYDEKESTIRKITPTGVVSTFAGTAHAIKRGVDDHGPATPFKRLSGVTTDFAGNVYVADSGYRIIHKVTPAGAVSKFAGGVAGIEEVKGWDDGVGAAARFDTPDGIATDSAQCLCRKRRRQRHNS